VGEWGWSVAGISVSAAAGAGFELIGRKPLAVLGWGLFIFFAGILPVVGLFALIAPTMIEMFRQMAMHPATPPNPSQFNGMGGVMVLNPLIQVFAMALRAMLCGAVFRAVLTPRDSAYAYLRIGMKELWLAVLFLAEGILSVVLVIAVAIPVAIVVTLSIIFLIHWVAAVFSVLTVLAALGPVIWILLRFSLAAPMTFEDGEFRLFESWALTRGHVGALLGMSLLLLLFLFLFELVMMAVIGLGALAVFGSFHFQHAEIAAFFARAPSVWIGNAAAGFLLAGLVWSFLIAGVHAVLFAPFAAFYRMVRPAPETAAAEPAPAPA
jgi:hypothetical protein